MEPEKPDRYTVLTVNSASLITAIAAATTLGLTWFAQCAPYDKTLVLLYIFFDQAGLAAYLANQYTAVTDQIRAWLFEYYDQAATAEDTLARIRDALQ
jgi:hypothetical protein